MAGQIAFFPVGNGDMTMVRLANADATTIIIDVRIRQAADDPEDETPDVAGELRKQLLIDADQRPYVDAFLLSHPDEDHCLGVRKHFWLGPIEDYPDDKKPQAEKRIVIREMWSSPMIFRRRNSLGLTLCDDAHAFHVEARRRVLRWKELGYALVGNGVRVFGEDEGGKTDNIQPILVKTGETFSTIGGHTYGDFFSAKLLAPMPKQDDETEETLSKNHSSVILSIELAPSSFSRNKTRFLTGGDAHTSIWERIWERYKETPEVLEYDLLQAPHHCSWHALSHHSWSTYGEDAEVSEGARSALGQARQGAIIVASSKKVVDDKNDPPCIRAKREYESILDDVNGIFLCVGDKAKPETIRFEVTSSGLVRAAVGIAAASSAVAAAAPRAGAKK